MQIIKVKDFYMLLIVFIFMFLVTSPTLFAQSEDTNKDKVALTEMREKLNTESRIKNAEHPQMKLAPPTEDESEDTYIIVDLTGSVTRSVCPYTCEDRGLPAEHCRTWYSILNSKQCYIKDTRITSDVF